MDERTLRKTLSDLEIGDIRFFSQVSSTNDIALAWATAGAPDFSLVIADEQTSGRGRMGRKWFTPPGTALAISLILRPSELEDRHVSLLSGLGALALAMTLQGYGLDARIKWPNDVLINRRKVAGILVEMVWLGEQIENAVLGVGINVLEASVPPHDQILFPATSVHSEGKQIDRVILLRDFLANVIALRPKVGLPEFVKAWDDNLAFKDEPVEVWAQVDTILTGIERGLEEDGALRLETKKGIQFIRFGEIHLRPARL
jgi:BirA family transcriptional regulator, biotin operon repressor / biotin---[acetyl-CoA-carboxylase] ligase